MHYVLSKPTEVRFFWDLIFIIYMFPWSAGGDLITVPKQGHKPGVPLAPPTNCLLLYIANANSPPTLTSYGCEKNIKDICQWDIGT